MLEISKVASLNTKGVKLGTSFKSQNGKYIFHISIIDYLQLYDLNKKLERFYKIFVNGAYGPELSSISSEPYKKRFLNFMKSKVFNYELHHPMDNINSFKIKKMNEVIVQDNHYNMTDSTENKKRDSNYNNDVPHFMLPKVVEVVEGELADDNILSQS